MKNKTLGMMISSLRKDKGMTQLELANLMNVTDKAVSKWERDISCPDINSIPKLAEALDVSVDELMQSKNNISTTSNKPIKEIISTILKAIPIAMGVAVVTLSILNAIKPTEAILLLGIGVTSAGIVLMSNSKNED
ncbi:helix-turn-helix transcriptional regulator [Oscillibacter sp.]|uniref:helix-turn-helix domain-containing protein n=1 Tax=Oscillibacter sp. TaxID=1945593 RepID=UPI00263A05B2|nr:helix-turn-helix transcriptional regulator [Oscillibacter sp.]MDD3346274.1 helix-turn-helix transcriptional regulator [Oscillibacter sp.]